MLNQFRRSILAFVAVAAVAMSCTSETEESPYTVITNDCGPADGPAVRIILSHQPIECKRDEHGRGSTVTHGPYMALQVWQGFPLHVGEVVSAAATRCKENDDCEAAQSAEITIERFDKEAALSGRYQLRFRDGHTVKGRFVATSCQVYMLCG